MRIKDFGLVWGLLCLLHVASAAPGESRGLPPAGQRPAWGPGAPHPALPMYGS